MMAHAERTEFGKKIRKAYEAGITNLHRWDMRRLVPRTDGIANTLTTLYGRELYLWEVWDPEMSEK